MAVISMLERKIKQSIRWYSRGINNANSKHVDKYATETLYIELHIFIGDNANNF